jgi:hypothetical protein
MVGVLTQYALSPDLTIEQVEQMNRDAAPRFLHMEGLIRKYFFVLEDGSGATGVYLWRDRETAEKFFTEEWKTFIAGKYGFRPKVSYFLCTVVVDNTSGEIVARE